MRAIRGKVTVETLARAGKSWMQGGKVTGPRVVAWYRQEYGLGRSRVAQLRKALAEVPEPAVSSDYWGYVGGTDQ